ncbi:MAG TPA: Ig-like domain-containing protein, partial [Clostridia bacterium]|nr:Ig-like domain-containing protein [Clostridia bacterium]
MQIEPGSLKCSQRNKRPRLLSGLLFALAVSTGYGQYYFDQFTRESDPAPVTPWIVQSGAWTVTGGSALGAGTQNLSYATAYITNTLGEYSVEARLRFPAGAYGGGISGRLSPETGARYAAWIYPDGSPGGGNTLKLIKFNTWTTFGYSNVTSLPMRQVALPSVGTDWHTVKLQFQTNHITIFYDGTEVISMNDLNGPVFASGSVSLDLWRNQTAYDMMVDDVAVIAAPPIANADSYVVLAGGSLTVATPGVLANDTGGAGDLTAALVDGPSHGSLTLQADGGFVYTPEPEFVGADSFSYLAGDGTSNSAPVLVNLAINQNHAPAAVDDAYTVTANTTLAVVAPGVLGNDNDPENLPLTAVLVSGTTNGTVILDPNGGFSYSPVFGFVGTDAFTYRASDGSISSLVATAIIAVMPGGRWFVDNFDRTLEPGPITPWISRAGSWAVSEGVLLAGTNAPLTYAWAYLTNSWTNYTVQARVRFPAGAFGGALSGCLDMATGSRYSAWIYPAGSSGGPNVLKLVKFKTWTTFNYQGITGATIAQVPLAPVGTDWHSLKLAFLGSRIGVYYDGEMVLSVSDLEAQPYPGGSVSLDLWTDPAGYQMAFDDVLVDPLVGDDQYGVSGGATLVVPPPGVLVNDTGVFGTNLAAVLVSAPATGALTLNSNGGFVFEPPAGFDGVTTFQYRVDEGSSNSLTGTVTLLINDAADPPTLPVQPDFLVDELITLVITNTGADPDLPADALSYVLTSALPGAVINGNGVITWTPSEADGPGTNWLTTVVSDQSNPPLRATNVIQVVVREVNAPPVIPTTPDQVVSELTEMVITHLAADGDLPANQVSYVLEEAPAGAVMDAQGVFRWLPTEEQGPSTNVVSIVALDDGTPPMSATNRFTVVVTEANQAPSLPVLPDLTIDELTPLQVINAAADLDLPAQGLNYELALGPAGAAIDQQGTITWQPSEAQGPSTNVFATIVTDGVGGSSFATNSFTVIVKEVNEGPVLPSVSEVTLTEMSPLWVTNAAVDIDQPANALSYTLIEAPEGAVIDNSGLIHWVPTENHGPGTSLFVTVVTDDAESPLSATNSFLVHVVETNAYPVLPVQVDRSIIVTESITITNTAADPDVPENTLQYALSIAPAGAGISADGVISWVAGPGNENTTNVFETVVTDSGTPPLSATNRFSVVVLPRPAFLVDTMVLSAESCVPSNGGIDPGETVTIGISFKNPGPGDVANLVVELQATTNVLATSEPQVFGPVPDSASTGAQPFTFTASGSCGGSLTLRFNVYDGEVSLGTTVVNWGMGQEQTVLSETFDSVAAPDLPTGWSTAASGSHPVWNVAAGPGESAPNAVFSPGASDAGVSELVTPEIVLAGTSPELV